MSSLDLELDARLDDLELEWREAREASIIARQNTSLSAPTLRPMLPPST